MTGQKPQAAGDRAGDHGGEGAGAGECASPPCYAAEIDPGYFDPPAAPEDIPAWRRAERRRLRAARMELAVEARAGISGGLMRALEAFLEARLDGARGRVFSAYWPIKGEPDLRPLMHALHEAGALVALPLVETKAAPLVFRRWTPETRMVRGDWNIPVPPPEAPAVTPEIALAPLVGWDSQGFRLGYGGGYFDRTLAREPRPYTIGIGVQSARLATIHPQPHDIPLDAIVTEAGLQVLRRAP
ncbi:5-formyltetrahydrofolate cyclo-ligase [Paralimibaculum aggregatum]|uniref:5-formyltetrahydrofolate cyclo-ligase n=1 Tax=Paralimibaculum aggregatum TaxID=3036245 RepID=A0ABQ6LQT7_9RHOB|nr:5-formyltetrahydrofolate cyclo-ligase [Limibaculum sp. NKW23]GMG84028.1 5-formyltetrahydrofolate cyclo-ligase [Limibaculum sp. NKW23]